MTFLGKPILITILLSTVLSAVFSFAKIDLASIGDPIRETFSNGVNKFLALAQEVVSDETYFFPTYPQRLMYLAAEMSQAGEELVALNQGLVSETEKCDCKFALSQCLKSGLGTFSSCQSGPLNVFGDPCANREEIDKKRLEIMDKNDQITHLRNLLQKEMDTGLERELMTLRPEVAQDLRNNLTAILEESKNIIPPSETNLGLLKVSQIGNCSATCELGPICGIKACVMLGTGEQKQITLKFKVGVALDDLKLGKIGIKNINLALPEEIQLPKIEDAAITIPAQEVVITFPQKTLSELEASKILDLSSQSISLSPQISLRQPEPIKLSCPKLSFLKAPELPSLPELPEKIEIPLPKIPEIKFCPKLPTLPKIPGIPGIEKIEEMVKEFEKGISEIEEKIKTATNIAEKNKLNEEIRKLKEESQKIKEAAKIPEVKTPEVKLPTPEIPKKFTELKLPEIKSPGIELPQLGLSSSYQCLFASQDGKTTESAESIEPWWYFQTFSFLSEKCQTLPAMTGLTGLAEKAKDCFDPENVHLAIIKECDDFWQSYPTEGSPPPVPPICQSLGSSCLGKQRTKERECKNLFNQENKPIPQGCYLEVLCQTNKPIYCMVPGYCGSDGTDIPGYITKENVETIIKTLEEGCNQLKADGKKDPPEPCKILPLFTGKIEAPYSEEYSTSKVSCLTQKIGDFPSGLGGIQLNCPLALPTLPKISFPKIIVPDIIMPEFNIPPFIKIKLPNFIFEDLVLPDFNLCNLDDCQNIFPSLNFRLPFLNLPQLSPSLRIPPLDVLFKGIPIKIPLPDIKLAIRLPSIPFNLPQLNLGNLLLPELEIPEISLPTPKITFGFSGIDLSAIFDLISTFILNALGIPDFSLCISFKIPSALLVIAFPDYYVSWLDFPKIPEIPFCKDASQFCQTLKGSLKEVIDKAKEIEKIFNQFTQTKIQAKLDELTQTINNELTKQTNLIMEKYAQIIRTAVKERMAEVEGNIDAYIDPVDKKLKIPPIVKTLPEQKIDLPLSEIGNLLGTITIPWPEDLKKIKLTKPLTYDLPTIPLSKLNYQKEIPIKGPGFQSRTLTVDLGNLGGSGDCLSDSPTGGNPLPVSQFQSNLGNIINIRSEIQNASNKIIDILE